MCPPALKCVHVQALVCLVHQHMQRYHWNMVMFGTKPLLNRIQQHLQYIRTRSKSIRKVPGLNYWKSLGWQKRTIRLSGTEILSLLTLVKCAISSLMNTRNQDFRVAFISKSVQAGYQYLDSKCPSYKARGSRS